MVLGTPEMTKYSQNVANTNDESDAPKHQSFLDLDLQQKLINEN